LVVHSAISRVAVLGAGILVSCAAIFGYRDGPPTGMTGGFDDNSCITCHTGNPLNSPGGSLRISGLPANYDLGKAYRVRVIVTRPDVTVAGFEIVARTKEREAVGTWRALDDRVKVDEVYLVQTLKGAKSAKAGSNQWDFEWTAPLRKMGTVYFQASANASNDDASALGDFIYTTQALVSEPLRSPRF
jgi:hypothetical protein